MSLNSQLFLDFIAILSLFSSVSLENLAERFQPWVALKFIQEFVGLYICKVVDHKLPFFISVVSKSKAFSAGIKNNFDSIAWKIFIDGFKTRKVESIQVFQTTDCDSSPGTPNFFNGKIEGDFGHLFFFSEIPKNQVWPFLFCPIREAKIICKGDEGCPMCLYFDLRLQLQIFYVIYSDGIGANKEILFVELSMIDDNRSVLSYVESVLIAISMPGDWREGRPACCFSVLHQIIISDCLSREVIVSFFENKAK